MRGSQRGLLAAGEYSRHLVAPTCRSGGADRTISRQAPCPTQQSDRAHAGGRHTLSRQLHRCSL